ncbi:MAG: SGNH/GDSL hydrolase family protein, partial [Armatimonadota bacterium]|nr:SGNH/GDSL hydrolase family protein [Armatimonadota bacterium]
MLTTHWLAARAFHVVGASLNLSLSLMLATTTSAARGAEPATFRPPKNVGDPASLGLGIQRTMTLLATSTEQHRNTVRILFYGQSITEGGWWKSVADNLRRRFPHANLVIENRALGGFSSQRLVKTAESDLYSYYPDLMIFHVYGAHNDYEDIIRRTRERTTTEVLIQTDHATKDEDLNEETDPAKIRTEGKMWNSFMNYVHLPNVARKYGCGIVDQRNLWKQYLRDHNLRAAQLLKDAVHPNDWGNYVMAELTKAYLVRRDDVAIDPMNCDTVKTFAVGKDVRWQNGKLTLPFD